VLILWRDTIQKRSRKKQGVLQEGVLSETRPTISRRVPVQERAFAAGDLIGINGDRVNRTRLKQRFAEGGYHLHETPYFFLITRALAPQAILVHWFAPQEIDANLGQFFLQELKPLGLLAHPQDFGEVFAAVVFSLFPTIQSALSVSTPSIRCGGTSRC
jgi:hypothetical protein